jgi:hypothetical protein
LALVLVIDETSWERELTQSFAIDAKDLIWVETGVRTGEHNDTGARGYHSFS